MPISTPSQITVPFATSGLKNAIPAAANPVTGNAGYDAGFPATNMTPKEAGGIPPFGQDFNGILFDITTAIRYLEAGMQFPYSSAFATAVGGYPIGAIVARTDGTGFWRNSAANNMTDPEAFGAGWSPEGSSISAVAMAGSNVTLTALQSARSTIIITGTLTANLNLIFPTYQRQWLIVNNATGAFSVTCKTASGSGVAISTGLVQIIFCDGTNISGYVPVPNATESVRGIAQIATQTTVNVGADDATFVTPLKAAISAPSVRSTFNNLKISTTGASAIVTVAFSGLIVSSNDGRASTLRGLTLTASTSASGAGGIDTGTVAANTWYSIWVIYDPLLGNQAVILSLSSTTPTIPWAGNIRYSRVGWIYTDGTANKYPLNMIQYGRRSQWVLGNNVSSARSMTAGVQGTAISPPTFVAVPIGAFVPVTASSITCTIHNVNGGAGVIVAPNNNYGGYDSTTNLPPLAISAPSATSLNLNATASMVLESTNIYYASSSSSGQLIAWGWEDNL